MPTITLLCIMVPITAESVTDKMVNSFCVYKMKANIDKFQHILFLMT